MTRLLALFFALLCQPVLAQTAVKQSGNVTPGHPTMWTTNGIVQDAGSAYQGLLTGLGATASGPGICQNSGPVTGPYNQLCFNVTNAGAGLSLNNYGGASGGFNFTLNGASQAIPVVLINTYSPQSYNARAGGAQTLKSAVTTTAGGTSVTVSSGVFTQADVGKYISILGRGTAIRAQSVIVNAGSGYTTAQQTVTVSGGTCTTQPTLKIFVAGGVVVQSYPINPGACSVQPANPVSTTGGDGSGFTANLTWNPLASTISVVTDGTHITVADNAALTAGGTTTIVYGWDDTQAITSAANAANTSALNGGAGVLALCGRYMINTAGSIAVNIAANPGFSMVGSCPGTTVYMAGTGGYWGIFIGGTTGAATTITVNASEGDSAITLASSAGFSVGQPILINAVFDGGGDSQGLSDIVTSISGNVVSLQAALPFGINASDTTIVTAMVPAFHPIVKDITFDCSSSANTGNNSGALVTALVMEYVTDPYVSDVYGQNCSAVNQQAFQVYGSWGGWFNIADNSSGCCDTTDEMIFYYTTGASITYNGYDGKGFGINFDYSAYNKLHIHQNGVVGRGVKFLGSCKNTGDLQVSGVPSGYTAVAFTSGSCNNNFDTVIVDNAYQCLWSNGQANTGNHVSDLRIANCSNAGIAIGATDTGWQIANVNRGPNVAADSISTTDQKIQYAYMNQTNTFTAIPQIINLNTAALTGVATDYLLIGGADGAPVGNDYQAFGTGALAYLQFSTALGTNASKTAVTAGTVLGAINFDGWNTAIYAPGAQLRAYAEGGTWTSSSTPGEFCVQTTPTGSTTKRDAACVHQDGSLGIIGAFGQSGLPFGSLPTPFVGEGPIYITDGKASNCGDTSCTTWGTTVTGGGGSLKLFVWYNGANYTLLGK